MEENRGSFWNMSVIMGIVIVVVGLLALLMNLGYDINISIWDYWPLILVLVGLSRLIQPPQYRSVLSGLIFTLLGGLLLLNNLEVIDFGFSELWPVILIIIGVSIVMRGSGRPKGNELDADHININAILGGGEYNFVSKDVKGGSVTTVMGGAKINLREADTSDDPMIIDVFAVMGGVDIEVPRNWEVIMKGTPILGGMDNKTKLEPSQGVPTRKLIVKGTAFMGGVDVKN
jgi:predicted membrane protein